MPDDELNERLSINGEVGNRMDRRNLEPHDRLRPDVTWLRQLLRPRDGNAAQGNGLAEVPERR